MRTLMFFIFCALLMACAKKDTAVSAQSILKACPSFAETGKPALVYGAECGELLVKENPADAQSRDIAIHILRLPAISPAPKHDPLFLIQGGPGGSSIDMAAMIYGAFADVRKNRDLIFVDQRGTGKSNPMLCDKLQDDDQLLPEFEQTEKTLQFIKACAEKYQQQVSFYTTPYAVKDLDVVRRALGYEKINLWGVSYGTRVALEYMREFPQQTRAVILDGVAPVQIALPKYFQTDAQAALDAVNKECQAQEKCKLLYGDIVEKAEHVTQRFAKALADNNPMKVQFEHPRNQQPTTAVLTPKWFAGLIFMSLYSRDLTVLLPHAISDADNGNYRLLTSLFALASEQSSFSGISEGMRYSVVCNEDAQFISTDDIKNAKSFFGMNMMKDFADVCAVWPKASLSETYSQPIVSDIPTLLLSGHHDPVTPSRWAEMVAKYLSHSLQVVAPGGNHSISAEGCTPKIIAQFIELGSLENIKTDCVKNIVSLPLVLGANEKKVSSSSSSQSVLQESNGSSSVRSSLP